MGYVDPMGEELWMAVASAMEALRCRPRHDRLRHDAAHQLMQRAAQGLPSLHHLI